MHQPLREIETQPVDEQDATVVAGRYGRLAVASGQRIAFRRRLKRPRRRIEPWFQEVAHCRAYALRAGYRRGSLSLLSGSVRLPAARDMCFRHFAGRGTAQGAPRSGRQPRERFQHVRPRRLSQPRPNPAAPLGVLPLQVDDRCAGLQGGSFGSAASA